MAVKKILTGHTSLQTAYLAVIFGTMKCYWIQTRPMWGDRLATITINSLSGDMQPIEYGPDYTFAYLFLDLGGEVKLGSFDFDGLPADNQKQFAELLAAFDLSTFYDDQQNYIREKYYESLYDYAVDQRRKLTPAGVRRLGEWMIPTLSHVENCPFGQIAAHPEWISQDGDYPALPVEQAA